MLAPLCPLGGVRIVAAFEGFTVGVPGILHVSPAIGTEIAEFTVPAGFNLVFGNMPGVLKTGLIDGLR
jgi:hypothetical protein